MKRLTKDQIREIKELHINLSLRSIQNKLNIPLSTIQYHLRDKNRARIKKIIVPNSKFLIGEMIGAFAGDGNYYHDTSWNASKHNITYSLSFKKDKEYAEYLKKGLKSLGLNVLEYTRTYNGKNSSIELRVSSIELINLIKKNIVWSDKKTYSVHLSKKIEDYENDFLFGFVRGIMDTDGFVETSGLGCGLISRQLIENMKDILESINIKPKITVKKRVNRKDLYLLRIHSRDLKKYYEEIGFSNQRKMIELKNILIKNGATRI